MLHYASFVTSSFAQNKIFDLSDSSNRDNCFYPYYLMRQLFKLRHFELNTEDINEGKPVLLELHLDIRIKSVNKFCYALMLETPQIWPLNGCPEKFATYRKIFTWNDDLVDGDRFIKINFPNQILINPIDGFDNRPRLCCLVASNKTLQVFDERNLYVERIKTIRWFEKNAANDFELYGIGWDAPEACGCVLGKLQSRLYKVLGRFIKLRPFPSYRGKIKSKSVVLKSTRFVICYENIRDLPGYITEKIFDCFFSGCVPVYWGATNISEYIPSDCFIDRRQFANTEAVYNYIKKINEEEFRGYQQRIAAFLRSDAVYQFSSDFFAETIVNTIVQDLGT